MTTFDFLLQGLTVALDPMILLYALIGVTLGTAVGVPARHRPRAHRGTPPAGHLRLDPAASLIMFAGIYYGGMYGGSTTSILLNTPGESASVITALEGNKMPARAALAPRSPPPPSAPSWPDCSPHSRSPSSRLMW